MQSRYVGSNNMDISSGYGLPMDAFTSRKRLNYVG